MPSKVRQDISKLKKYAEGLGYKVIIKPLPRNGKDAGWIDFDDKEIVVMVRKSDSLKSQVATLLHEVSHLVTYSTNPSVFKEYLSLPQDDNILTKEQRFIIYERERLDILNMVPLAKLLNIESLSMNDLMYNVQYDLWNYRFFYLKGRFSNTKEKKAKKKQLKIYYGLLSLS